MAKDQGTTGSTAERASVCIALAALLLPVWLHLLASAVQLSRQTGRYGAAEALDALIPAVPFGAVVAVLLVSALRAREAGRVARAIAWFLVLLFVVLSLLLCASWG